MKRLRMTGEASRSERVPGALIAFVAILGITTVWWALALWPTGATEPEWLTRTGAACFGSRRGGLPDAGGWILLIGEPLGMIATLIAIWGRSLREDVRWIGARRGGRFLLASALGALFLFVSVFGVRTARAWAAPEVVLVGPRNVAQRIDRAAPTIALVDQRGARWALAEFRGRKAIVTFAYGHCLTVCPSIVTDVQAALRRLNRVGVPLFIVTLDPWRDTPERLPTLAEHWGLGSTDRVLSGSVADVEAVLDQVGIGRRRNETIGDVDHATTVMILDGAGKFAWRIDGGAVGVAELL